MIQLESNTATDEELQSALASLGVEAPPEEKPVEVPEPQSEPTGEPGDKVAAEPEGKTEPVTEPVKKESQEVPPGEPEKAKGGWARKVEKLTARIDSLQDRLEEKSGGEERLRAELAEAKAELAKANTVKPAEEVKGPVRPKRPTLAECDYDQDKLEAKMGEYDDLVDAYHKEVATQSSEEAVKKERERQAKDAADAKIQAANDAFAARRDAGKTHYPDWQEVLDDAGDAVTVADKSEAVQSYIASKTKNPADLIYFFLKDLRDNDGAENERIAALDPFDQLFELKAIEERITKDRAVVVTPPKKEEPPKAAAADTPKTPVKEQPKPTKTPDAPIETLGGRTVANPGNFQKRLEDASKLDDGGKEYRKIRNEQKVAEARATGRVSV